MTQDTRLWEEYNKRLQEQHKGNRLVFLRDRYEYLRRPDISRVMALYSHLIDLGINFQFIGSVLEKGHAYNDIDVAANIDNSNLHQKIFMRDLKDAKGMRLSLGDESQWREDFYVNQADSDNPAVLGRFILTPVRRLIEKVPFVQKPTDIDLILTEYETPKSYYY